MRKSDEMWDGFLEYVQSYDVAFFGPTSKRKLIIDCDTSLLTVKAQNAIRLCKAVYVQELTSKRLRNTSGVSLATAIELTSWAKWHSSKKGLQ